MKIISPFRDYYDVALAHGHDEERLYERVTEITTMPANVWPYSGDLLRALESLPDSGYYNRVHRPGLLLFCGSAWPVFYRHLYGSPAFAEDLPRRIASARLVETWVRHYDGLRDSLDRAEREEASRFFRRDDGTRLWPTERTSDPTTERRMRETEAKIVGRPLGEDLLIERRAPCALVLDDKRWSGPPTEIAIVTNPRLADLEFQRVLDPYACYQEIETFLGSQLAAPDLAPQRVGGDEVIARQKGFDAESFRTAAPGVKKQNRARNRARKRGETEP